MPPFSPMLFSSWPFILIFLPIFLFLWHRFSSSVSPSTALGTLFLCASLLFYSLWGFGFLLLLIFIISLNYLAALYLGDNRNRYPLSPREAENIRSRRRLFIICICLNLLPLLWFKYSSFIINNLALFFNQNWNFEAPALPLGISFYTFIQIAWLHDIYSGQAKRETFSQHALFSCGFPWLIAGPIVRQRDISAQLSCLGPMTAPDCAKGFTLFSIGLAKKLLLADSCGLYADNVFNAAAAGWPISFLESWAGSLFYTFQLYFDFSGYTDMALGLGLIMGLSLPENFNSPYRASGIVDFWRRWHITLGSWLRDFIYIPLGGNRKGKARQYLNLFLTMLLGGIWHGAGWTYILWGALHGLMLAINHAWKTLKKERKILLNKSLPLNMLSILFTFCCLNFCWVLFRSANLDAAIHIYHSMFRPALPLQPMDSLSSFLAGMLPNHYIAGWQPFFLLILAAFICWFMPNSQNILKLVFAKRHISPLWYKTWSFYFAFLAFLALFFSGRQANFLYFQF